jgi:hypothetical protein
MIKILKSIGWFILMYLFNIIYELDVFINVLIFFGQPKETISSHFGRCFPNSWFAKFVDLLFSWQKVQSHCRDAALSFRGSTKKDLIPKATAEQRVVQIFIVLFFIFIIIHFIIGLI